MSLVGTITIYTLLLSVFYGKGDIKVGIPFTDITKVYSWDNISGPSNTTDVSPHILPK